jgi:E3 ubiquitin-protein ligase SHPRH
LKRHAPSLKVFVYPGWTKFAGPITEDDVEDFRLLRREKAAKSKKRARRRRIGSKTASSSRKRKRDQTGEDDYMDVDINAGDGVYEDIDDEEEDDLLDWCSYINTFDVCITTYPVLQQDLTIARAPYVRPRRDTATYLNIERSRSPLVMCEWYRVIMDEVQMAGGGKIELRCISNPVLSY